MKNSNKDIAGGMVEGDGPNGDTNNSQAALKVTTIETNDLNNTLHVSKVSKTESKSGSDSSSDYDTGALAATG